MPRAPNKFVGGTILAGSGPGPVIHLVTYDAVGWKPCTLIGYWPSDPRESDPPVNPSFALKEGPSHPTPSLFVVHPHAFLLRLFK